MDVMAAKKLNFYGEKGLTYGSQKTEFLWRKKSSQKTEFAYIFVMAAKKLHFFLFLFWQPKN